MAVTSTAIRGGSFDNKSERFRRVWAGFAQARFLVRRPASARVRFAGRGEAVRSRGERGLPGTLARQRIARRRHRHDRGRCGGGRLRGTVRGAPERAGPVARGDRRDTGEGAAEAVPEHHHHGAESVILAGPHGDQPPQAADQEAEAFGQAGREGDAFEHERNINTMRKGSQGKLSLSISLVLEPEAWRRSQHGMRSLQS